MIIISCFIKKLTATDSVSGRDSGATGRTTCERRLPCHSWTAMSRSRSKCRRRLGAYCDAATTSTVESLPVVSTQVQLRQMRQKLSQCGCRGKFVAPGKFFPPPYCHNVTNANPNPSPNHNLNPSPNPNPNLNPNPNPKINPILNLNPKPYCCVWE